MEKKMNKDDACKLVAYEKVYGARGITMEMALDLNEAREIIKQEDDCLKVVGMYGAILGERLASLRPAPYWAQEIMIKYGVSYE